MSSAVADAPASVAGGEFRPELPLTQIVASKTNPRRHFDEGYLRELAGSIKEKGLIQPVVVRPMNGLRGMIAHPEGSARTSELFEIVAGECRYRASKQAGLLVIPAIVREYSD